MRERASWPAREACAPERLKPNDCLETPSWVYRSLGEFDLDPCAGPHTSIAKVNWSITRGEDGLSRDWFGFVYCNPPFSQKERWARRMVEHDNGILLLPERGSAPWFGPLAQCAGRYWVMGKKINFVGGPSSNNLGSVLFPFGELACSRLLASGLPGHMARVTHHRGRDAAEIGRQMQGAEKGGSDA